MLSYTRIKNVNLRWWRRRLPGAIGRRGRREDVEAGALVPTLVLDPLARARFNTPPSRSFSRLRLIGQVAQLVEQRTENPRVGGSIPPLATNRINDLSQTFHHRFSRLLHTLRNSGV